jgi:hypothetical protein
MRQRRRAGPARFALAAGGALALAALEGVAAPLLPAPRDTAVVGGGGGAAGVEDSASAGAEGAAMSA